MPPKALLTAVTACANGGYLTSHFLLATVALCRHTISLGSLAPCHTCHTQVPSLSTLWGNTAMAGSFRQRAPPTGRSMCLACGLASAHSTDCQQSSTGRQARTAKCLCRARVTAHVACYFSLLLCYIRGTLELVSRLFSALKSSELALYVCSCTSNCLAGIPTFCTMRRAHS